MKIVIERCNVIIRHQKYFGSVVQEQLLTDPENLEFYAHFQVEFN